MKQISNFPSICKFPQHFLSLGWCHLTGTHVMYLLNYMQKEIFYSQLRRIKDCKGIVHTQLSPNMTFGQHVDILYKLYNKLQAFRMRQPSECASLVDNCFNAVFLYRCTSRLDLYQTNYSHNYNNSFHYIVSMYIFAFHNTDTITVYRSVYTCIYIMADKYTFCMIFIIQ